MDGCGVAPKEGVQTRSGAGFGTRPRICIMQSLCDKLQVFRLAYGKSLEKFDSLLPAVVRLDRCIALNGDSALERNRPLAPATGAPWSIEDRPSAGGERKQLGACGQIARPDR